MSAPTRLERVIASVLGALGFELPTWTRPTIHLTDTEPRELTSSALPWATSMLQVFVAGGPLKGAPRNTWATGASGTFRFDGRAVDTIDALVTASEHVPVRVWLEGRDGAVRVMVANTDPERPVFVRFDGLHEVRTVASGQE